jgi:general stress protein 26
MAAAPIRHTEWDTPYTYGYNEEELLAAVAASPSCVFIRNRKDGHPIGAVVGFRVVDGEIYTITNTFRDGYRAVLRDPRVCVVFDNPGVGGITVIGRAEVVDDPDFIERAYRQGAENHYFVTSGRQTVEQYIRMAVTPNRRLLHIVREKVLSLDLLRLPMESEL